MSVVRRVRRFKEIWELSESSPIFIYERSELWLFTGWSRGSFWGTNKRQTQTQMNNELNKLLVSIEWIRGIIECIDVDLIRLCSSGNHVFNRFSWSQCVTKVKPTDLIAGQIKCKNYYKSSAVKINYLCKMMVASR